MLLIKTYLDKSAIHGIGLYAGESIKQGQKVYALDDILTQTFDVATVERAGLKPFFEHYAWVYKGKYYLSLDNDRFMNHSDAPNVVDVFWENYSYAARDIAAGEELTCNYNSFCEKGLIYEHS